MEQGKIIELDLSQIVSNTFNPRTSFPEGELRELSLSISENGVIQAIVVRPKGKKFETVCGERRVKASRLAGKKTIRAEVRTLTDEQAIELAFIENLQRSDVPPLEEAIAFANLVQTRKYDVAALCAKFAKSEKYIRGRLALNDLVEGFKTLLSENVINVGVAMEICKFSHEIQQEVFTEHFQSDQGYNSWRNYGVKELARAINRKYTTDLKQYFFDKTGCHDCPFNSNVFSLFGEAAEQGNCSKKSCLVAKNTEFIFNAAKQLVDEDPKRLLCYIYSPNSAVNELLVETGYTVTVQNEFRSYPSLPLPPAVSPDADPQENEEAQADYQREVEGYHQIMDQYREQLEQGKIIECVEIASTKVNLGFVTTSQTTKPIDPKAELLRLQLKDKRNKEIAMEKTIADTKELIHKTLYKDDFSELEEQALYYLMLSSLKKSHFGDFGLKNAFYLGEKERLRLSGKLTEEKKTLIRRDFLVHHLTSQVDSGLQLLLKFARQHMPDELAAIEKRHTEEYEKRHKRLDERIKGLELCIKED